MKKRKVEPGGSDPEFRAIRAELGLILPRFGELLGVSRGAAADWSRGDNRPSKTAVRLARLYVRFHRLGVPIDVMMSEDCAWVERYLQIRKDEDVE